MTDSIADEVRFRVVVDNDTPDLFRRLAGAKRLSREALHLMRLGLQMEMMLNGKLPMISMAVEGGVRPTTQVPQALVAVSTPVASVQPSANIDVGTQLGEMMGLDASYFDGPGNYTD